MELLTVFFGCFCFFHMVTLVGWHGMGSSFFGSRGFDTLSTHPTRFESPFSHPLAMRLQPHTAGNVVFSEIMMLPNGMSKGCGCVSASELGREHPCPSLTLVLSNAEWSSFLNPRKPRKRFAT